MNVSCVIPARNSERWIDDCLKPIRGQRLDNPIETVVVVDNSPTDRLWSRVEFHTADWPQLPYVHQAQNGGFGAACNYGFTRIHGGWTLFLNADVTVSPSALDAILRPGTLGQVSNIGSGNEMTSINLIRLPVHTLAEQADVSAEGYTKIITFVADRPGYDRTYVPNSRQLHASRDWTTDSPVIGSLVQSTRQPAWR